jgi:hypothetical protein
VVVTIPSCWYVLQPSAGHHDDHEKHHEGKHIVGGDEDKEEGGEEPKDGEQASDEDPSKTQKESTEKSGGETKTVSEKKVEGAASKKAPSGTEKVEEFGSGGKKKRIDSEYQTNIGYDDETSGTDAVSGLTSVQSSYLTGQQPASAKKAGGFQTQSGKQEGLSNTDTRHSTDISENSEKSKKGEGTAETAKLKGTVDPTRPQAESKERGKKSQND